MPLPIPGPCLAEDPDLACPKLSDPPKKKKKKQLASECPLDDVPGQDPANPGGWVSDTGQRSPDQLPFVWQAQWLTYLGLSFYIFKNLPGG